MVTATHGHPTNHRRLAKGTTRRSGLPALSQMSFASALLISALKSLLDSSFRRFRGGLGRLFTSTHPHRRVQEPGGGAFKPVSAEPWVHRLRSGLVAPTTEAGIRTRQQGSDHGELQVSAHQHQPHALNAGGPRADPPASVGSVRQTPSPGRSTYAFGAVCSCSPSAATTLSTVASSGCRVSESAW